MSDLLKQLRHEAGIFRKGGANGRADLIGNAADLIDQLQQEREALAAHVEQIKELAQDPEKHHENGKWVYSIDAHSLDGVFMNLPTTSLAERDTELLKKFGESVLDEVCFEGEDLNGRPESSILRENFETQLEEWVERVKRGDA